VTDTIIIECTKEHPWDLIDRPGQRIRHHDAEEVGEQVEQDFGGDTVTMFCPHCGTRWTIWTMELPE
jgi:hypothetical protein